jgi:hypothetical protein
VDTDQDFLPVCRLDDLEVERGAAALVHGQAIALFRTPDGHVHAVGTREASGNGKTTEPATHNDDAMHARTFLGCGLVRVLHRAKHSHEPTGPSIDCPIDRPIDRCTDRCTARRGRGHRIERGVHRFTPRSSCRSRRRMVLPNRA